MNKKGQELSLNTLIVIILLVIVLIVVAVFFLGGTSSLSKSIRSIFYGTTAGTDRNLAIETCRQRCEQARSFPAAIRGTSAYCKQPFSMDLDNDGNVDVGSGGTTVKYYCSGSTIGVSCNDDEGKPICPGGNPGDF
ncbi:MAG: hypothetical protein HYU48_02595 [Candidatus Levybacteria bacterium]|nr:hypothetical protein [Candidatus Levybacteria bacterium]MBI2499492.1 hypothetical protein [Candidatus Woesearchaeota archaeon]